MNAMTAPAAKTVPCPACKGPSLYAPGNPYRPFCSARCRQIDLGAWASEAFKLPTADAPGDEGADSV